LQNIFKYPKWSFAMVSIHVMKVFKICDQKIKIRFTALLS
jgi:hypothetical protein